jgi:hypothetical protein
MLVHKLIFSDILENIISNYWNRETFLISDKYGILIINVPRPKYCRKVINPPKECKAEQGQTFWFMLSERILIFGATVTSMISKSSRYSTMRASTFLMTKITSNLEW